MADSLKITPSESVEIHKSSPELLEVEATYGPDGKAPPAHWHPAQEEHFEVIEGRLRVRTPEGERTLAAGDEIEIPREAVHQMWNPHEVPAKVRWQTRPAGRTERWFRALDRLHREGRVGRNGMPGPLAFGVMLTEYDDTFRLDAKPQFLVRGLLRGLGAIGRLRGYSPDPD
jgi:mannose-6-phosphate isomerase-like protein (cupin superfamily)